MRRALLLTVILALLPLAALAQETVAVFSMEPATQYALVGETFDVEIAVSAATEIDFLRINVAYDAGYLALASIAEGDLAAVFQDVDTPGVIDYRVQASEPISGSLTAATITFTATTPITETALGFDPEYTKAMLYGERLEPTEFLTGTVVTIEEYVPPEGAALILIDPGQTTATSGDTFWATIWVMDALDVVGWRGALTYNDGVLAPTGDYVLGGLLPSDALISMVDFLEGQVVGSQFDGVAHSGEGRLMAVEFEAIAPGESTFTFEETVPGDGYLFRIGAPAQPLIAEPAPQLVTVETCLGDFAPEWGFRDLGDIMAMIGAWNTYAGDPGYRADMDLYPRDAPDGEIGLGDIMMVVEVWNTPCP